MDAYRIVFTAKVADGSLRPLVLPYHLWGYVALILYLSIPHTNRPWLYAARWPVLAGILAFQWKTLWEATSMSMATGFAAGLMSSWGAVWSITWLVFYKPQFEAKRVQGRPKKRTEEEIHTNGSVIVGTGSANAPNGNGTLRKRKEENGPGKKEANGDALTSKKQLSRTSYDFEPGKHDSETTEYYWQSYPDTFMERFWWTCDLIINFRLPGWNLAIPPLPALSPALNTQLGEHVDRASISGVSSVGLKRYNTRRELARGRLPMFILGYFALDFLKVLMMNDPYFIFGRTTYELPSYIKGASPLALKFIRQAISSYAIIISLEMIFLIPPIGMSLILTPKILGQRAEAWYFPTTWGSWSNVMNKGLNGLWGSWWHQTFRFAFSAPSNFLINTGYIPAHSMLGRMSALFFAFGISGILHSGGSISQFPKTDWTHAPIFFMLQAVGILIQMTLCSLLHPAIRKMPRKVRQAGNFAFTSLWLLYTGYWLIDDFARGGMWLYEPIPFSPLRGLGFGEKDAKWWCWEHIGIRWYSGKHWWESGLAI